MKKILSIILVFVFCFTLFSCDGSNNGEGENSGEWEYVLPTPVVDADISFPFTSADEFNPYSAKSKLNRLLIPMIYESLYNSTEDGYGYPQLALSATESGKTVTVKLKQGIVFSDGTPFNAQNVKYSYNLAKKNAYYKNQLKSISEFKVLDNFTLRFTFSDNMLMPLNALSFPIVLKTDSEVLGTGKYLLKYLDTEPYFEVNKNHEKYSPSWNKQIALYDMSGYSSELYAFKANKISVFNDDLTSGIYENLSSKTVSLNTNSLVYAGLNMKWAGSLTSVAWVRRVLNIGINRVDIGASSFLGQTSPVTTPFKNEFYKLSGQELLEISGDLNRAINILEENGYDKFNSEGYRTDGVNVLQFSILVSTENDYKVGVAEALKKSLNTLGIKANIIKRNGEQYLKALEDGHFEIYIGEITLPSNSDLSEFFVEKGNVSYGISDKMKLFYDDFKNGKSSMTDFIETFYTNVPFLPLFYRKTVMSVNPAISGISDAEGNVFSSVNDWKVDESMQKNEQN